MGASGSGKTTLMNILGCLDRPTEGLFRFMGEDVSGFDRDELARLRRDAFGFVFQSYNLIATATAEENVEVPAIYSGMPPQERSARARELLTTLGLAERLGHRPSQLSGGQQPRVSIARAPEIAHPPINMPMVATSPAACWKPQKRPSVPCAPTCSALCSRCSGS